VELSGINVTHVPALNSQLEQMGRVLLLGLKTQSPQPRLVGPRVWLDETAAVSLTVPSVLVLLSVEKYAL
jgi:hypothetical protein